MEQNTSAENRPEKAPPLAFTERERGRSDREAGARLPVDLRRTDYWGRSARGATEKWACRYRVNEARGGGGDS